jgi:hypothetical protein
MVPRGGEEDERKVGFLTRCGAFPSVALLSASEIFSNTDYYIPEVSSCSSLSELDFAEALDSDGSLALRSSRKVAGPCATSSSSKKSAYLTMLFRLSLSNFFWTSRLQVLPEFPKMFFCLLQDVRKLISLRDLPDASIQYNIATFKQPLLTV